MRLRELVLLAALALPPLAQAQAAAPTRAAVQQAVEQARAHPDLGGSVTERRLRWREREAPQPAAESDAAWRWLRELLRWINETARLLVWAAGAVLVALLLVGLRRWVALGGLRRPQRFELPSHVQSLDIRPESLPDAIGAAAAQLWQRGEHRAALSLLYRGALSRLVHGYRVPIRAASTEGECVALAQDRLEAPRADFFARLVRVWQLAVYGGRLPDEAQALALCRAFDAQLPAPVGAAAPAGPSLGAAR